MFEVALITYVVAALVLTVASGLGALILHMLYGPTLPHGTRQMADAFMSVYGTGSAVLLAPLKYVVGKNVSPPNSRQPQPPPFPPPGSNKEQ